MTRKVFATDGVSHGFARPNSRAVIFFYYTIPPLNLCTSIPLTAK